MFSSTFRLISISYFSLDLLIPSMRASPAPGANMMPNTIALSDDELDALDSLPANALTGCKLRVLSVKLQQ